MQFVKSVVAVRLFASWVNEFRDPEVFGADFMDSPGTHDNCINRRPQQAHDEAVTIVRAADRFAAGVTRKPVADDTIEGGDKIANDIRATTGRCREMKIASVEITKGRGKPRFSRLDPLKEGFDRFHHEFQAAIEVKGVRRSIMCRNSALKRGS